MKRGDLYVLSSANHICGIVEGDPGISMGHVRYLMPGSVGLYLETLDDDWMELHPTGGKVYGKCKLLVGDAVYIIHVSDLRAL